MFHPQSFKKRSPPPYQVIDLVAHHLDPTTLSIACCVSKSWSFSMSTDHLWQHICTLTYPSLSRLHLTSNLSYHKLYSLGRSADTRRRKPPTKPRLSMLDFMFAIEIWNNCETVASIVIPGNELEVDRNGIFRFDIDMGSVRGGGLVVFDELDSLRITWNVLLDGYKRVFTMMDCKGKGNFVLGLEGWFSKELPVSGCCLSGGGSGLVAELRLGLKEGGVGGKVEIGKMSVGVLSVMSWRYVLVDDALRYLQHFLLPS